MALYGQGPDVSSLVAAVGVKCFVIPDFGPYCVDGAVPPDVTAVGSALTLCALSFSPSCVGQMKLPNACLQASFSISARVAGEFTSWWSTERACATPAAALARAAQEKRDALAAAGPSGACLLLLTTRL